MERFRARTPDGTGRLTKSHGGGGAARPHPLANSSAHSETAGGILDLVLVVNEQTREKKNTQSFKFENRRFTTLMTRYRLILGS